MLWSALFIVTATVWMPVEQEVARLVGARSARGEGARPVSLAGARASASIGGPSVAVVATVALAGTGAFGRDGLCIALDSATRRAITAGWAVGVALALVVLALGDDLILRVELVLHAGSLAAVAAHGPTLAGRLGAWSATG